MAAEIVRAGWATKRGQIKKNWKRRYFVLRRDSTLAYYRTQSFLQTKPQGLIQLTKAIQFRGPHECDREIIWPKISAVNARFEIQIPGRIFHIFCDTPHECEDWLLKLQSVTGIESSYKETRTSSTRSSVRKQSEDELFQHQLRQSLKELVSQNGNNTCFDCGQENPTWASWNIGVFLCLACAGNHRSLGKRVSKVKNINLDTWTDAQVNAMRTMGNNYAKAIYLSCAPERLTVPSDPIEAEMFLVEKYVKNKFGAPMHFGDSDSSEEDVDATATDDKPNHAAISEHTTLTMNVELSQKNAESDPMSTHECLAVNHTCYENTQTMTARTLAPVYLIYG
eukprot:gene9017-1346_t